ncbi:hypothetical protein BXT90_05465 [Corynebacterium amycolatum]|uniref:hypothetical protein n=1 Tax=Corynebacterium amycolatum TaxID=43765 RepID=UPI0009767512|nr:hypothetical protein [Corynebacterium amycolatum]OMQ08324.1 hypothetical protein BXT90_05465 [Corynebacterium amycolatum]
MTTPEPKDYGVPAGAMRPGDLGKLQNINGDSINWGQLTGITAAAEEARNGFVAGLRESIVKPLQQIFSGLKPPGWEKVAEAFEDGQTALKNRLDLLSPLLDYGSAYMDAQGGFLQFGNNHGTMPFTNQIGPMRGCELHDNGIRLLAAGLWDIRCQMAYGNNALGVGNGTVEWFIRVYRPDGALFSEQIGLEANVWTKTSTIVSSVVVPEPGYTVRVEVAWIHGSRRLLGGPRNNRLVVQHISNKVGVGGTGAEDSYKEEINPDGEVEP